jgi:hypothetical protein
MGINDTSTLTATVHYYIVSMQKDSVLEVYKL